MEDIKIIFVDIDWTIFDHSKRPSRFDKGSIRELKKVQKKGIKVFLCTARPYHSVDQIKLLKLFTPDGMIVANGGMIIYQNEIMYASYMDKKEFEYFCDLALSYGANVEGIRPYDCFLIKEKDKAVDELFATYPEEVPPVEDYHNQEVIGCGLFAYKDLDEFIRPKLPKDFYYFRYHDYGVDVASIPHIKGEAIKIVLDKLNISRDNAMAIGDDIADISMFEQVKYGVAMGNAKKETIEASTHITDTVTRHGVKKILKELI